MQMELEIFLSLRVSIFISVVALVYSSGMFREYHILLLIQTIVEIYIKKKKKVLLMVSL